VPAELCYDAAIPPVARQALPMNTLRYFKRHRMELDLRHPRPEAELPHGFYWQPWSADLLEMHARVKFHCFASETDADVFPCLGSLAGCRDLMTAIVTRPGFCRGATWLVAGAEGFVATVQGLLDPEGHGGIQNLGVVPGYRGVGLGRALLLKALDGFAAAGARRAFLEVTATNEPAVKMYRRYGFRAYKTLYRAVAVQPLVDAAVGVGI
jgi:ribosomal protein S18 acetylase RimI-like enzyme